MSEESNLSAETDAKKQNRRVLIRPKTFRELERLALLEEAEVAELVNRACREMLKKEGRWPPSEPDKRKESS